MNIDAPVRLLLGPQRPTINLPDAIAAAGIEAASVSVISAGWQEAENDIDDVRSLVPFPLTDLCLYRRAEIVFSEHRELADAYRARQERLKEQQRLYRLRLRQLAIATRATLSADGEASMLAAEQRHAIAQLRALDRHHLRRTNLAHADFESRYSPDRHPELGRHRAEIAETLDATDAVLITGGNIIVLLNRMRLFGLGELIAGKPIIAWSAGAMVLMERIVLFHDRMPHGKRDAEVLGRGLGLIGGYIILPDPARRLRTDDKLRISFMSRRFSPDTCLTLDSGSAVEFRQAHVARADAVRTLTRNGRVTKLRAA
jgi:hypothetical protein